MQFRLDKHNTTIKTLNRKLKDGELKLCCKLWKERKCLEALCDFASAFAVRHLASNVGVGGRHFCARRCLKDEKIISASCCYLEIVIT